MNNISHILTLCRVGLSPDSLNLTTNSSALKYNSTDPYELYPVTTGSFWKPYVTTIGLFNEDNELLVVGKLAQPIRMSDETDTTFIVRYDT